HGILPSLPAPVQSNEQQSLRAHDLNVFDAMQRSRLPLQGEHTTVVLAHSLRSQLADGHVRADRPASKKLADIRINLDHDLQSKLLLSRRGYRHRRDLAAAVRLSGGIRWIT